MPHVLEVIDLKKSYGTLHAVRGVSFHVREGECYGLLGPNGAGKSTTIEMIEQITRPNSGKILYRGEPIDHHFVDQLGVQFQETALPQKLTVKETLTTFSRLYPRPIPVETLINTCQLTPFVNQQHDRISGGQRQRLHLALALCNDPSLILLDEPTTGLDPQARRHLWDIVEDIKKGGKTIILTTHYMDEAFQLCDRIGIMDQGILIAEGQPEVLLAENFKTVVVEIPSTVASDVKDLGDVQIVRRDRTTEIHTPDLNHTLRQLGATGADLRTMQVRQSNLEDLFLKLTGKELRP